MGRGESLEVSTRHGSAAGVLSEPPADVLGPREPQGARTCVEPLELLVGQIAN